MANYLISVYLKFSLFEVFIKSAVLIIFLKKIFT